MRTEARIQSKLDRIREHRDAVVADRKKKVEDNRVSFDKKSEVNDYNTYHK